MIRLFKHYIPYPVIFLGLIDFLLLLMAAEAGWILRALQINMTVGSVLDRPAPIFSFAFALQMALIAVGIYGPEALQSLRFAAARILVAISLGVILLSLLSFAMPGVTLWRSNSLYAMVLAILFLMVIRILLQTSAADPRRRPACRPDCSVGETAGKRFHHRRLCGYERRA